MIVVRFDLNQQMKFRKIHALHFRTVNYGKDLCKSCDETPEQIAYFLNLLNGGNYAIKWLLHMVAN